jgi:hypothetical protein
MTEAPYQDLVPSREIAQAGEALALKGEYYLFRIKVPPPYNRHAEIHLEESHRYMVDLIDPWLMKIYALGVTSGGLQAFDAHCDRCLLRFTRAQGADPKGPVQPIHALIAKFLNDPTNPEPPAAVPIEPAPMVYGAEYTIGELMDNPKTDALLKRYLPNLPKIRFIRIFSLEQLQLGAMGPIDAYGDVAGLIKALHQVPVEWKRSR